MRSLVLATLTLSLALMDCKGFSEHEMKGMLVVNLAQMGNSKLELDDLDTKDMRFVEPGKKIIEFDQHLRTTDIYVMDSKRVRIGHFIVPNKFFDDRTDSLHVPAQAIHQAWNLEGARQWVSLRREYVPKTGGQNCTPAACDVRTSGTCQGVRGLAWQVDDGRYDYQLNFVNEATLGNMAAFSATGEKTTSVTTVDLGTCTPSLWISNEPEAFE